MNSCLLVVTSIIYTPSVYIHVLDLISVFHLLHSADYQQNQLSAVPVPPSSADNQEFTVISLIGIHYTIGSSVYFNNSFEGYEFQQAQLIWLKSFLSRTYIKKRTFK